MTQKRLSSLIDEIIFTYGIDGTPAVLDKIKNFGYKYATISGVTWSIDNVHVPEGKPALCARRSCS
jgi:DNA-directed RNA polymerase subunit beta'